MPRYSVFGEYQLLFDLYPRMEFCPFVPGKTTSRETLEELGADGDVEEFRVMCLSSDDFEELCDLYPGTAESLKIQGLKKRKLFMDCLLKQENDASAQQTKTSTMIYKGSIRAHSRYRQDEVK